MSITPFLRRLAQGLVPLCLFVGLWAQTTRPVAASKHPFLWRIDGKGDKTFAKKSWLYGTMHLGDERLVTLPESVEKARESADAVYFEMTIDQLQKQRLEVALMMRLPRGRTLQEVLPRDLYQKLSRYVASRGAGMRTLNRMRVWAVSLHVDLIDAAREKMTSKLDSMIYKDAKAADKEVGGLETLKEHLGGLAGMPEEDQIRVLDQYLDYLEELAAKGRRPVREMLDVYLSGDGARILAMVDEGLGRDKELKARWMRTMVTDRNARMADRMATMMAEHPQKAYFFAVGALHYLGKNGIVEILRGKGYRIQRIGAPGKKQAESRPLERVGR